MLQITSEEDYLQFHSQENLKKKKIYHLNLLKDLISQIYIYRPRSKFISGPGNISQVFSARHNPVRELFSSSSLNICRYRPSQLSLLARFLFHLCPPPSSSPPSSAGEEIYIRVPDCKKGKKVHEKVFGSRPANIVHSNLFPLYFPPLFYFSFDLLVLSSSC